RYLLVFCFFGQNLFVSGQFFLFCDLYFFLALKKSCFFMFLFKKIKSLFTLFTVSLTSLLFPIPVWATGIDKQIDEWFTPIADWWEQVVFFTIPFTDSISIPVVLILLVCGGVFFTIYFRLVNIRKLPVTLRVIRGKYDDIEQKPSADGTPVAGELTHFQALTAALSGTVGLGNIAGVSVAIAIGGPGATFWMIVSGLLGMTTKFVE